ncbi:glutaredoxin [Thermococcus sp.]|uniref:glutaredoxin n=1 Tax=Thermococcus sp. TaxID=35749 RepID=UPI0025CF3664|nr:glutaredoxin [Thermococcus sp.]
MKRYAILVVLLVLGGFAAGCISSGTSTKTSTTQSNEPAGYTIINGTKIYFNELHFYMYGMKTCPHCRHMHTLIPETFGEDSLTYYELVGNDTNDRIFNELSRLTGISGVPAIGITYKGKLRGVLEGEFNVSATPQIVYQAIEHSGILLEVGGRWYILPYNDTKSQAYIEQLYTIFVKNRLPKVNQTSG